MKHGFWFFLSIACVLWYGSLVFYVGYRGGKDIVSMLKDMKSERDKGGE